MSANSSPQQLNHLEMPLGQRIGEILEERGKAFSIRAFSSRIGLTKDMLGRMISGERYLSPSELERIAGELSLPVLRIKMKDTQQISQELQGLLKSKKNNKRALELALLLNQSAVGITERFFCLNDLGSAFYILHRYDEAHSTWELAEEQAVKLVDKYGNFEPLNKVLTNLILSSTLRRDYASLNELVARVKPLFADSPEILARLSYSCAMVSDAAGYLEGTRYKLHEALYHEREAGRAGSIGKAEHNIGIVEYKLGNYSAAEEYFLKAIQTLEEYVENRLLAVLQYIKTLLRVGKKTKAKEWVEKSLREFDDLDLPQLKAKFIMLFAIVNQDVDVAKRVLLSGDADSHLKHIACKFLMGHYKESGDSENLMRYYVIAEQYSLKSSAIYDEMGLYN